MAGRRFTTLCGPHGPAKLDLLSRGCNGHTSFVRKLTTAALKRRLLTTDQVNSSFCRRRWLHKTPVSQTILRSQYPSVEIPELSIAQYVFELMDNYGNRPALIDSDTGEVLSFSEMKERIAAVSSGLTRLGMTQGDTLLMISYNSPDYVVIMYAVWMLGGTVSMINPAYKPEEMLNQVEKAGASFIYTDEESYQKAAQLSQTPHINIKKIISHGNHRGANIVSYDTLIADSGSAAVTVSVNCRDDVAMMPFSSGTTGLPKGVMINHYSQVANILQTRSDLFWKQTEGAVLLGCLPFYHMFAIHTNICAGVAYGQTTVCMRRFEPEQFLVNMDKYKVNTLHLAPPIVLFLLNNPGAQEFDLSSLGRVGVAAAPISAPLVIEFKEKYPNCCIGQMYGLSETGPIMTINPMSDCLSKPGSAGKLLPNTEAKFVDPVTNEECGVSEVGEIWCRGPQNMMGYVKNQKATDETIDREGWLHTGDIGYHDEDGNIYVVDRLKELIKYKGLQVAPAELEGVVMTHASVADVAVIGVPDEDTGEVPKAFVVLKEGKKATKKCISDHVADNCSSFKKLRGGVTFVDSIPKSPSGKILRRELRAAANYK